MVRRRERKYQGLLVLLFRLSLSFSLTTISHWKRPRIYNISFSVVHTTIQRTLNHGGDREYVYTYIYIYLFVFRERTRGSVGTLPLVHLPPPPPKPVKCVPEETGAFVDVQSSMIEERAHAPVHRIPTPAAGYIGAD